MRAQIVLVALAAVVAQDATVTAPAAEGVRRHPRGFKRSMRPPQEVWTRLNISKADVLAAPQSIDWSDKGATSAIKDQDQCGSCWAFSVTETVESAIFMSTGRLPSALSTEELVDCDTGDDGCDGGDIPTAVRYLKRHGMATAKDYPDRSSASGDTERCKWNKKAAVSVSGFSYVVPPCEGGTCTTDEDALAAGLAKYGPLAVCINSGDRQSGDWDKYKGGVLKKTCTPEYKRVDHCVQLVGYNKGAPTPYWKVRNSWGNDWGENGYIRLEMGKNQCCIGCEVAHISATMATMEV